MSAPGRPGLRGLTLFVGAALLVACGLPLCPFATLTGIPCPGCGLLRASLSALHGDYSGAVHYHPLAPLAWPAGILGSWLVTTRRPLAPRFRSVLDVVSAALVVALLSVWVARFFGAFGGPVAVRSLVSGGVPR